MARPATSTVNGGVQVIARAAQILRALDGEPHGLSLSQLSERLDLPRSTVHRVVSALSAEGLLASASPNGRVRLGPELARLALASRRELRLERPNPELWRQVVIVRGWSCVRRRRCRLARVRG